MTLLLVKNMDYEWWNGEQALDGAQVIKVKKCLKNIGQDLLPVKVNLLYFHYRIGSMAHFILNWNYLILFRNNVFLTFNKN